MNETLTFIKNTYEALHPLAEPAFGEVKTAQFVAKTLVDLGLPVQEHVGKTGVVGLIDCGIAGPTVAIRSDMDALTFTNGTGAKEAVHACGHDAHMTIALAVARNLVKEKFPGRVKFLFQPAEEIGAGALALIRDGAIDDVDYLIGYHVLPETLAKSGTVVPQINWTSCHLIEAEIIGKTAHGSEPEKGINAISVGVDIVNRVSAIECNQCNRTNVKATRFMGGNGSLNSICDKVTLGFDLRSTSNEEIEALEKTIFSVIESSAAKYGAKSSARVVGTCPAAYADISLREITARTVSEVLSAKALLDPVSLTIGEDFNFYKQFKPSLKTASLGIGCGVTTNLHDPNLTLDVASLAKPVKLLTQLIKNLLTEIP